MPKGKQKEWLDISNEKWREYVQPHQYGAATMRITDPVSLAIGEEGHTIKDKKGVTHEIPRTWLKITFEERKYVDEKEEVKDE